MTRFSTYCCFSSKFLIAKNAYNAGYNDGLRDATDCTEKEKWISVESKLPPEGNNVIVAIRDTSGDTPFTYTDCGWCLGEKRGWIVDNDLHFNVTHWQPLPEPPKERRRK